MSFCEQILELARKSPDKVIVNEVHGNTIVPHTFQELIHRVVSCQTTLLHMGAVPGQRFALLGQNSFKWIAMDLAIISLGCVSVPFNTIKSPHTLLSMMKDAKVSHLIYFDQDLADQIQSIDVEDDSIKYRHAYDFFHTPDPEEELSLKEFSSDDLATLIYSIRTSQKNKGVLLSRGDIGVLLNQSLERFASLSKHEQDSVFHFLPLSYGSSRLMVWTQLVRGNPISLSTNLENLEQETAAVKPNYFLSGPKAIEVMYEKAQAKILLEASSIRYLYKKTSHWSRLKDLGSLGIVKRCMLWILQKTLLPILHPNITHQLDFILTGSPLTDETQEWFSMLGIPVYPINDFFDIHGMQTFDHSHIPQE